MKADSLYELNVRSSDSLYDYIKRSVYEQIRTADLRNYCDTIEDLFCESSFRYREFSLGRSFYRLSLQLTLDINDEIPKLQLSNDKLSYYLGVRLTDALGFRYKHTPCELLSFPPQMETLPVDTIYGEPYYNVIRLTDTYIEANGKGTDILAYHIHPDYGIIKWEEKSGVIWEVEIE